MTKDQLLRYATLKSEIKRLTTEMNELNPIIFNSMLEDNHDEIILPEVGKFYLKERRIWTYPEEINEKEIVLKADKKRAQQVGTATCDITKELNFRGANEQGTEEV